MFINTLMLSISSSLDSISIGITYGLRKTRFSILSRIVFFIVSFVVTTFSILLGNIVKCIFSPKFTVFLGGVLIIGIGIYVIINSFRSPKDFDFDKSNDINIREALALSISLTMDSLCIGIGASVLGINTHIFPFFVATLNLVFLFIGYLLGKSLVSIDKIPNNIWNLLSGFLLVIIGGCRFL